MRVEGQKFRGLGFGKGFEGRVEIWDLGFRV